MDSLTYQAGETDPAGLLPESLQVVEGTLVLGAGSEFRPHGEQGVGCQTAQAHGLEEDTATDPVIGCGKHFAEAFDGLDFHRILQGQSTGGDEFVDDAHPIVHAGLARHFLFQLGQSIKLIGFLLAAHDRGHNAHGT